GKCRALGSSPRVTGGGVAAKRKGPVSRPLAKSEMFQRLTLGELEGTTGLGLTVLLTFNNTAVAGQEATLLQSRTQSRFEVGESLGDTVTNGTGLTGQTTTSDGHVDVVLVEALSSNDRLLDDQLQNRT